MLGYEKGITLLKNQKGNGVAESAHVELLPKAQAHLPYAYERKRVISKLFFRASSGSMLVSNRLIGHASSSCVGGEINSN